MREAPVFRDHAVPSIERGAVASRPPLVQQYQPPRLQSGPRNIRDQYRPLYAEHRTPPQDRRAVRVLIPENAEIIDLVSPPRPQYERPVMRAHDRPLEHPLHDRPAYRLQPPHLVAVQRQDYSFAPISPYHGDAYTHPVVEYIGTPPLQRVQPVHGAPAPVQQVPRLYAEAPRQPHVPTNGAVAPTQYYHPR